MLKHKIIILLISKMSNMTTTALKTNIKKQINDLNDETILLSIHTILKEVLHKDISESSLTKEQKAELDETLSEHKAGKLKYYTIEQAKKNYLQNW